jgi:enoyl-CoA hydratase
MTHGTILFEAEGSVATIRLNRPSRMNALVEEMYLDIQEALNRVRSDEDIRVVILTGSALKKDGVEKQAFCAGADLKKHSAGERTREQKRAYILLAHETTRRIYELPKPVIAAVNGPARGAGAEMAVSCDFIFMAEDATLAFPETGLGTFVGGGVTYHLPRIVGLAKAKDLIYSGRILDGREALAMGLASRCFPLDRLMEQSMAFARALADKAPLAMMLAKQHLQHSPGLNLDTALHMEAEAILSCMETEDWLEGIRAFAQRRKPIFKGK